MCYEKGSCIIIFHGHNWKFKAISWTCIQKFYINIRTDVGGWYCITIVHFHTRSHLSLMCSILNWISNKHIYWYVLVAVIKLQPSQMCDDITPEYHSPSSSSFSNNIDTFQLIGNENGRWSWYFSSLLRFAHTNAIIYRVQMWANVDLSYQLTTSSVSIVNCRRQLIIIAITY